MRTAWAASVCVISVCCAPASGADSVRLGAGLEASLDAQVGGGWSGDLPGGGAIEGLAFALEDEGFADDGLTIDGALATGDGVTVTMGGDDSNENDRATVVPLPSGAAAALAGLGFLGLRRTRRTI